MRKDPRATALIPQGGTDGMKGNWNSGRTPGD
jgi:hypothetical protein